MFPFVLLGGAALLYFLVKGSSGEKITVANGVASNAGMDLLTAQRALQKLGYSVGSFGADNRYGDGTKAGLLDFQKANKLSLTGIVDLATARYLAAVVPPGGFPASGGKPASGDTQPEVEPEGLDTEYPDGVVDSDGTYEPQKFGEGSKNDINVMYEAGWECGWLDGHTFWEGIGRSFSDKEYWHDYLDKYSLCGAEHKDDESFRAGYKDAWFEKFYRTMDVPG